MHITREKKIQGARRTRGAVDGKKKNQKPSKGKDGSLRGMRGGEGEIKNGRKFGEIHDWGRATNKPRGRRTLHKGRGCCQEMGSEKREDETLLNDLEIYARKTNVAESRKRKPRKVEGPKEKETTRKKRERVGVRKKDSSIHE